MTQKETVKVLRRQLDAARVTAKQYRKSYNQPQEQYHQGKADAISQAIEMIESSEPAMPEIEAWYIIQDLRKGITNNTSEQTKELIRGCIRTLINYYGQPEEVHA